MKDFESYAKHLYTFSGIPIYLYEDTVLKKCFPPSIMPLTPPVRYIHDLLMTPDSVSYLCVHNEFYWGKVCLENQPYSIILGPVSQIYPSARSVKLLAADYVIVAEEEMLFQYLCDSMTCILLQKFMSILFTLDCLLNEHPSANTMANLFPQDNGLHKDSIVSRYQDAYYSHSENESLYNNSTIEQEFCDIIENGDLKRLNDFSRKAHQRARYGVLANSRLRQLKNTFIILATLASRAAIKGGLSSVFAYEMADVYIKHAEELHDEQSIYALMSSLQRDFCMRVAEIKKVPIQDNTIQNAIEYIHANLNKKLTVESVAHEIGLSRSYLSRRFKAELGFSLNSFIRRCKLEEAKSLLLYSDKSISHISEYLYFSSQSNFQNAFKKQFGITPKECRTKKYN